MKFHKINYILSSLVSHTAKDYTLVTRICYIKVMNTRAFHKTFFFFFDMVKNRRLEAYFLINNMVL